MNLFLLKCSIQIMTMVPGIAVGLVPHAQSQSQSIVPPGCYVESRSLEFGEQILVVGLGFGFSRDDAINWAKKWGLEVIEDGTRPWVRSLGERDAIHGLFVEAGRLRFLYFDDLSEQFGNSGLGKLVIGFPALHPDKPKPARLVHVDLSPKSLQTAESLAPKGSVVLATALNGGTGLMLLNLPSGWNWGEFNSWKRSHRLSEKNPMSMAPVNPPDLDSASILPRSGLGSWGWAELADGVNPDTFLERVLVGFPVDYASPHVQTFQRVQPRSMLEQPPDDTDDRAFIPPGGYVDGSFLKDTEWLTLVRMPKAWSMERTAAWCLDHHLGAMLPVGRSPIRKASDLLSAMIPIYSESWGWADLYMDKTEQSVDHLVIGRPTDKP